MAVSLTLTKSEIKDLEGEIPLISHMSSMLREHSAASFLEERIPLI